VKIQKGNWSKIWLFLLVGATNAHAAVALPCMERVSATLDRWEVPVKWELVSGGEVTHLKSKTNDKNVAIHLRHGPTFSELSRESLTERRNLNFGLPNCALRFKVEPLQPSHAKSEGYTDLELSQLLEKSRSKSLKGLIYIWSPNMVLSVKGLSEAAVIAKDLSVELIPLLDPFANLQNAQRVANVHHLPAQSLVRLKAQELMRLDALIHYPALFMFADGYLLNLTRLGYDEPKELRQLIKDNLR
jgi:hypothetical protein